MKTVNATLPIQLKTCDLTHQWSKLSLCNANALIGINALQALVLQNVQLAAPQKICMKKAESELEVVVFAFSLKMFND